MISNNFKDYNYILNILSRSKLETFSENARINNSTVQNKLKMHVQWRQH